MTKRVSKRIYYALDLTIKATKTCYNKSIVSDCAQLRLIFNITEGD